MGKPNSSKAKRAWLVTVDLKAVARRLTGSSGHHRDELDAINFLTGAHVTKGGHRESSPLRATQQLGMYYIDDVDPTLLLEPDEVMAIVKCAVMNHPELITGA